MDLIKAEINRKRKINEDFHKLNGTNNTKFLRQSDVMKMREDKLKEEQERINKEKQDKLEIKNRKIGTMESLTQKESLKNSSADDDFTNNKNNQNIMITGSHSKPKLVKRDEDIVAQVNLFSISQIKTKLRSFGMPITLFGENDEHRRERLVEKTIEYDPSIHYSEMTHLSKEKIIYKFFRSIIKQWELDLNTRENHEKLTAKGKMETKTQKQCKDYIRPLFKMCKNQTVPFDILQKISEMVKFCEDGNFRLANDIYISTAIGNSAWPIGLTMVGIHERSGRERISTSKVAHIMNNELQRKYLTSVKRLMTYAQMKRPDIPPSMKVS
eukprot:gene4864-6815_t